MAQETIEKWEIERETARSTAGAALFTINAAYGVGMMYWGGDDVVDKVALMFKGTGFGSHAWVLCKMRGGRILRYAAYHLTPLEGRVARRDPIVFLAALAEGIAPPQDWADVSAQYHDGPLPKIEYHFENGSGSAMAMCVEGYYATDDEALEMAGTSLLSSTIEVYRTIDGKDVPIGTVRVAAIDTAGPTDPS